MSVPTLEYMHELARRVHAALAEMHPRVIVDVDATDPDDICLAVRSVRPLPEADVVQAMRLAHWSLDPEFLVACDGHGFNDAERSCSLVTVSDALAGVRCAAS